jgi:hypothetical protein
MAAVKKVERGLTMEKLILQCLQERSATEGDKHRQILVAGQDDYGGEVGGADFFGTLQGGGHRCLGGNGF